MHKKKILNDLLTSKNDLKITTKYPKLLYNDLTLLKV